MCLSCLFIWTKEWPPGPKPQNYLNGPFERVTSCFGFKLRQRGHHRSLGVKGLSSLLHSLQINTRKGSGERAAIRDQPSSELTLPNKAYFPTLHLPSGLLSSLTSPWGFRGDSQPPASHSGVWVKQLWREGHNRPHWPINSKLACSPWAQARLVPTLSLFPLFHAIKRGKLSRQLHPTIQEKEIDEK